MWHGLAWVVQQSTFGLLPGFSHTKRILARFFETVFKKRYTKETTPMNPPPPTIYMHGSKN
jgi:hypothetical protein